MKSPELKRRKIDYHKFEDSFMDGIHQSTQKMNSFEDLSTDGIDRLPDEILIQIIAYRYLSLRDRKNTRLVCWRWYNLNNMRCITSKEKFLCYGVYGLESVLQTLQRSEKKVLNLELVHFDFSVHRNRLLQFWKHSSARIESLSFRHCKFSNETIQDVIINCDKIRHFAIKNPRAKFQPCEIGQKLMSGPALEKLITIRRGNLHSFELEAYDERWISNNFLRVMFLIYPQIDDFSFNCRRFIDDKGFIATDMTNEDLLRSDVKLTFASIRKKLVDSMKMIRSINLEAEVTEVHSNFMLHDFPKLTSIGNVYLTPRAEHPIFDFLTRHNYLRCIEFRLEIVGTPKDRLFIESLMICLLDSCTQLKSLKIEAMEDVFLTDDRIFTKIRNSTLKSLYLNFLLRATHCDKNANKIINTTLKCLHLSHPKDAFCEDYKMVHPFVRTFRGLRELMIDRLGVSDELLQDIFLYQRQLTSLKLRSLALVHQEGVYLSDYGFTGIDSDGQRTGYSIKDLKNLQCLEISRWDEKATMEFFEELQLPNLSTLCLDLGGSKEFLTTVPDLPNLEKLVFKGPMSYATWLKICEHLKKLRFLYLESYFPAPHNWKFRDEHFVRLFQKCPTLRFLHRSKVYFTVDDENGVEDREKLYYKTYSYHLDTETNTVRMVKQPEERLFPPDMIDPFWVKTI